MKLRTIASDEVSGLNLLQDESDPPRFYVQWRQKRDLIAIGDEGLARQRFAVWCERGVERIVNRNRTLRQRSLRLVNSHQAA